MVAATNTITPEETDNKYKPIMAIAEHNASKPGDDTLCDIGPAKNLKTSIINDV